jgi:amidohydrolase
MTMTDALVALRREIHREPDLSHHEGPTAHRVQVFLRARGVTAFVPVPGTAGFAVRLGAPARHTVILKADLDALPLAEESGLPFASARPGAMHACGHDVHTAILAGVVLALHAEAAALGGEVRCIFQPAEEAEPLGARAVVAAGLLDGVGTALGFHVDPDLPVGVIGALAPGVRSANCDEVTVTVRGRSAHAARPHLGVDAIAVAAAFVQDAQTIASRLNSPLEPMALSFGRIAGGTMRNSLADRVVLEGTLRTTSPSQRTHVQATLARLAAGIGAAHDTAIECGVTAGEPAMVNDPRVTALARALAVDCVGEAQTSPLPTLSLGGDDFAFYLEKAPGVMVRFGTHNPALGCVHPLHHPRFRVDEAVIPLAVDYLVRLVRRVLAAGSL